MDEERYTDILGFKTAVNSAFRYLYHFLVFLNSKKEKESDFFKSATVSSFYNACVFKENLEKRGVKADGFPLRFNVYDNYEMADKKLFLDDLIQDMLFLKEYKKLVKKREKVGVDFLNMKREKEKTVFGIKRLFIKN